MKISFINATNSGLTVNSNMIRNTEGHDEVLQIFDQETNNIIMQIIDNITIQISNNGSVQTNVWADLNEIEIKDNSRATVELGFPIEKILLLSGNLDFTYSGSTPCNSKVYYTKGTEFILKSSAGFSMKFVLNNDEEQREYNFSTNSKEISSSSFDQLVEKINLIESCNGDYSLQLLREYSNLIKQDFIYDFLKSNMDVKKIESCITDNFFGVAFIAKDVADSNLGILPPEMLNHISSYLKVSDINLLGNSAQEDEAGCLIDDINS